MNLLVCHNCGAPLRVASGQTLALCPYCQASSRIDLLPDGPAQVTSAGTLSDDASRAIRQFLADGKRDEAVRRYQDELQCDHQQALLAVQGLFERNFFLKLLRKQLLNPLGIIVAILCVIAMAVSIALLVVGTLRPAIAVPLFGLALLLFPLRRALVTLSYFGSERGLALVKKLIWVGEIPIGSKTIHCARAWVDVRPEQGVAFTTSMDLVVRDRAKFGEGGQLEIKFLRGNPTSVLLARTPQQTLAASR